MVELFILRLGILLILIFLGYGFTALFLPKNLIKHSFWLTPWFGTILISILGFIMNFSNMRMDKLGYIVIMIAAMVLLVYSLLNKKRIPVITQENIMLLLLFFIGSYLYPNFIDAQITPVINNIYLQNHTLMYKVFKMYDLTYEGYKILPFTITNFFSTILQTTIKEAFETIQPVYIALLFYPAYLILKTIYQKIKNHNTRSGLWFFVSLFAFCEKTINWKPRPKNCVVVFNLEIKTYNLIIIFLLYSIAVIFIYKISGFTISHILFIGVSILFIIILLTNISQIYKERNTSTNFNNFDILLSTCLSVLLIIYPEIFKFILLTIIMLLIYLFIKRKKISLIYSFGRIMFLTFIINPIMLGIAMRIN